MSSSSTQYVRKGAAVKSPKVEYISAKAQEISRPTPRIRPVEMNSGRKFTRQPMSF